MAELPRQHTVLPWQRMVGVAQLVERWLVEPDVAGSSPVVHPNLNSRVGEVWVVESMASTASTAHPDVDRRERLVADVPWVTIVWNDPVNLMSYVSWVFRSYFGFAEAEAERRMMQVHLEGRAVVASGLREEMERHVEVLHDFGLWATLETHSA